MNYQLVLNCNKLHRAYSDIGEMFLNFMLEERCARLVGVHLTHYVKKGEGGPDGKRHLVRRGRCLMGRTPPPYKTGQGMGHTKEHIMGDPNDLYYVFKWKEVRINLPGTLEYDASMVNCSFIWKISARLAQTRRSAGGPIQDSPQKRREVSRYPGPWAGSMVYTDEAEAGVRVLVSRKKWAKAKQLLATLHGLVFASDWVYHKVL
jgi:hypothetical protein